MKKNISQTTFNNNQTDLFKKLIYDETKEHYLEEKKFVVFNVISKKENDSSIIALRTSIGYQISDSKVYDFVSKEIFETYQLYHKQNKEKEGQFALIHNIIFKNSTKKMRLNNKNLQKIDSILEKYIIEYKKGDAKLKDYSIEDNEEYIPDSVKRKTIY